MTDNQQSFIAEVKHEIHNILTGRYSRSNPSAHDNNGTIPETLPFWSAFDFHEVWWDDSSSCLGIVFSVAGHAVPRYGFRVNFWEAMDSWREQIGVGNIERNPAMYATEIIWFMVCFVGTSHLPDVPPNSDDVVWLNSGQEVFRELPAPASS